jgi:VCBS repeat-containing protein
MAEVPSTRFQYDGAGGPATKLVTATGTHRVNDPGEGQIIFVNSTTGVITLTLDTPLAGAGGKGFVTIKRVDGSANTVTIATQGAEQIRIIAGTLADTIAIAAWLTARLLWDGTSWQILGAVD